MMTYMLFPLIMTPAKSKMSFHAAVCSTVFQPISTPPKSQKKHKFSLFVVSVRKKPYFCRGKIF